LGWGLARLYLRFATGVQDIAISVVIQFLATFAVWIAADQLGLSTVITTVAYAVTLARQAPAHFDAEHRRASYAVWEVAVFVLNVLAFILVGLQLRGIVQRLDGDAGRYLLFAGAVLLTVVLVRIAWVMSYNTVVRWKHHRFGAHMPRPMMLRSVKTGAVISWCGMRGIVTLATALALPDGEGSAGFPYRDLVVAASFAVVLGTLVVQGLTLRPLLLMLRLGSDGAVEREVAHARVETARAAINALQGADRSEAGAILIGEYEARLGQAQSGNMSEAGTSVLPSALSRLRERDEIGDAAFHCIEEELDWAEVNAIRRGKVQ